jgi:hypothetical protein
MYPVVPENTMQEIVRPRIQGLGIGLGLEREKSFDDDDDDDGDGDETWSPTPIDLRAVGPIMCAQLITR